MVYTYTLYAGRGESSDQYAADDEVCSRPEGQTVYFPHSTGHEVVCVCVGVGVDAWVWVCHCMCARGVSFRGWRGMAPAIPWCHPLNCWKKLDSLFCILNHRN